MSNVIDTYDQDHPIVDPDDTTLTGFINVGPDGLLLCPMDECAGQLYIEWTGTMVLSADNTIGHLVDPQSAHSTNWEIGCTEGHTLLLPDHHGGDSNDFMQDCYAGGHSDVDEDRVVYHDDIGRLRKLLMRRSG